MGQILMNWVMLMLIKDVVAMVCGMKFLEIHEDLIVGGKEGGKLSMFIVSLIPILNIIIIYSVIKYYAINIDKGK